MEVLARWSRASPKPLVLLIDEIDALQGGSLLSALRQLRAGYRKRPGGFPQSVVLCGMRDMRDYRMDSTGSPFNIVAKSLRLGDFSREETLALLGQHTAETGQAFTAEAQETVWEQTLGQPWLVNALAQEACFESAAGRDRSRAVTGGDIADARERLILSRVTHLDQLAYRLEEERVRQVIEPILAGGDESAVADRDVEYARDLGLLAKDGPLRIANPVYAEVIPRELTWKAQAALRQDTAWYLDAGGGLDTAKLMAAFQRFFRENHWKDRFAYPEAWPQLLLQAFLQRVLNGGGRAGVRAGPGARRLADRLAEGRRRAEVRGRVQDTAREPGGDGRHGAGAGCGLHGPLRGGDGPPGDLRPRREKALEREGFPPFGIERRDLGHVTGNFPADSQDLRVEVSQAAALVYVSGDRAASCPRCAAKTGPLNSDAQRRWPLSRGRRPSLYLSKRPQHFLRRERHVGQPGAARR